VKIMSPELLIVLFLLALAIVQILRNTRRGRKPPAAPPARREAGVEDPEEPRWSDAPDEVRVWSAPMISAHDFGRAAAPAPARSPARGRYSRQALMGNRRDLRKAIVIAAILGPCRATDPHDVRH